MSFVTIRRQGRPLLGLFVLAAIFALAVGFFIMMPTQATPRASPETSQATIADTQVNIGQDVSQGRALSSSITCNFAVDCARANMTTVLSAYVDFERPPAALDATITGTSRDSPATTPQTPVSLRDWSISISGEAVFFRVSQTLLLLDLAAVLGAGLACSVYRRYRKAGVFSFHRLVGTSAAL